MAAKKSKHKKSPKRKSAQSKSKSASAKVLRKKAAAKPKPSRRAELGPATDVEFAPFAKRGLGARSAGQSGDTQGIQANPAVDSESVEELLEEGQSFEAEVLNGVENTPDPDESEVRTREVSEEDIPEEYREKD